MNRTKGFEPPAARKRIGVIGISSWDIPGLERAAGAAEAVEKAFGFP